MAIILSHVSELLLHTKLFVPPLRPLLVPRPRLLAKLDRGVGGKLSLVAAPAGFGKSTLIVHWLQQQARPAAWLSLDENDNVPLRFFTYLVAAIQSINSALAENLAAGLRSPTPPDETAVIPALLNELATTDQAPFILVLDDYHVITHEAIHAALAFLIDYLPTTLHLVVTSRKAPPLPLPRWRVRGQLNDIQAADLRFTTAEAAQFLGETMELTLSETAVSNLEARTEGWIAGLQLAALSLRSNTDRDQFIAEFVGSERQVADYLLQEVLFQQPEPIQQFLLQTAVLERFNAGLCNALLDQQNSQDILDKLEQSNLFIIPLDNSRYWYRYHHLFAQLLRYRLQRDWSETAVSDLHRRAAHWYKTQNLLDEAIAHTFQIPDHDEVARLLSTMPMHTIYEDGGAIRIKQWVKQLPTAMMPSHPYVAMLMAGASLISGDVKTLHLYLELVEGDEATQCYQDLFRSILIRNDSGNHQQALQLAQRALTGNRGNNDMLTSMAQIQMAVNYYVLGQLEAADGTLIKVRQSLQGDGAMFINMHLQAIEMQIQNAIAQGNLFRAEQLCLEGIDLASRDQQAQSPLIGIMYAELGNLYYQWNEMAKATTYIDQAMDWAQRTGISDIFTTSAFVQADMACASGDKEMLEKAIALIQSHLSSMRMEWAAKTMERLTAWYWLRMGDLETAVRWANGSGLTINDTPHYQERETYSTFVAIRLAESRKSGDKRQLSPMLAMMGKLENQVISSRHVIGLVNVLTLKALILNYQGNHAAAESALQKALSLAQPGSMQRVFLDRGEPIRPLLTQSISSHPNYVGQLLRAFVDEGETSVATAPDSDPFPIQLTARENEILQLIAAGLSNKQIEETLFVSKNTVRTHIKNLYSKLSVSSRTQAIKHARELNLIL
ncbi:MAG: hypothetical protein GY943_22365 [Chloroflexi bacterium]|nr:hypothetical protein [Chloroflexota bacterium]